MELENFRDAVLSQPADIVTLRQGVEAVEVADAVLAASHTGTWVSSATDGVPEPDLPPAAESAAAARVPT